MRAELSLTGLLRTVPDILTGVCEGFAEGASDGAPAGATDRLRNNARNALPQKSDRFMCSGETNAVYKGPRTGQRCGVTHRSSLGVEGVVLKRRIRSRLGTAAPVLE